MNFYKIREADAKGKSDFFAGLTDQHPHGLSGLKWVLPPECSGSGWDCSKQCLDFSEWGNSAWFVK